MSTRCTQILALASGWLAGRRSARGRTVADPATAIADFDRQGIELIATAEGIFAGHGPQMPFRPAPLAVECCWVGVYPTCTTCPGVAHWTPGL